jgi:hypothetical protein
MTNWFLIHDKLIQNHFVHVFMQKYPVNNAKNKLILWCENFFNVKL